MSNSWKCPFCKHAMLLNYFNVSRSHHDIDVENKHDANLRLNTSVVVCPNPDCREYTINVSLHKLVKVDEEYKYKAVESWKIRPDFDFVQYPQYVPEQIRKDYEEACKVIQLSPKASATLARRCLQGIIRDVWGVTKNSLYQEIQAIHGKVDPITWKAIDSVRNVGNIGAHMEKDINTIIDVNSDEAKTLVRLIEVLITEWYIHAHEREQQMRSVIDVADAKRSGKTR